MKSCFTLLIGLAGNFVFGQTTPIPDVAFEQHLIDIGADSGMPDGVVLTADIATITELHMISKGISNLSGIGDFAALTFLELDNNALTTLDVSQNTNLQFLFCSYNLLTSIDVSGCPDLYALDCDNNSLTNLDVSQNTNLESLFCSYNLLTGIDVTGSPDLHTLVCNYNDLTSLDASQNINLEFLSCSYNLLTSIDISGCPYLISLDCDNNNLTNLDVSMNPVLTYMNCGQNGLTALDISNNDLVLLACYQNDLTALDVSMHPNLEMLQCEGNQLTVLDLSDNPVLEFLNAGSNLLTGLDISSNTLVNEFYCSNNSALECLNVRNGNNVNFFHFEALNSPLLTCIEVDDSVWANDFWLGDVDAGTEFSNLCGNPCSSNQLGLPENAWHESFEIYPNPAQNFIQLRLSAAPEEDSYFECTDINGKLVYRQLIPAETTVTEFQLQDTEAGIYFVKWIQSDKTMTQRLIVE